MKLDKKLTIIITAFNASNFIGECLKSVCNQYNSKIEIIIINDGSTGELIICNAAIGCY